MVHIISYIYLFICGLFNSAVYIFCIIVSGAKRRELINFKTLKEGPSCNSRCYPLFALRTSGTSHWTWFAVPLVKALFWAKYGARRHLNQCRHTVARVLELLALIISHVSDKNNEGLGRGGRIEIISACSWIQTRRKTHCLAFTNTKTVLCYWTCLFLQSIYLLINALNKTPFVANIKHLPVFGTRLPYSDSLVEQRNTCLTRWSRYRIAFTVVTEVLEF